MGSRGVYRYYLLEPGKIYEISQPTSHNHCRRYFCVIQNQEEKILKTEEVLAIFQIKQEDTQGETRHIKGKVIPLLAYQEERDA